MNEEQNELKEEQQDTSKLIPGPVQPVELDPNHPESWPKPHVPEKPKIENAALSAIPSEAPRKPKRKRVPSRADRWAEACANAGSLDDTLSALEDLRSIQEEYESWKENLPEGLQSSALGEKLDAVCSIDIDGAIDQIQTVIDVINEADGADLPLGWGKD